MDFVRASLLLLRLHLLILLSLTTVVVAFWISPSSTSPVSKVKTGSQPLLVNNNNNRRRDFPNPIMKTWMASSMVDADHNKGTPILAEKLIFTDDNNNNNNSDLHLKRQDAFRRFQTIVESLMEDLHKAQVSLIWNSDREVNHEGVIPINSLLFQDNNTGEPIIVVVPSSSRVDVRKLEDHLMANGNNNENKNQEQQLGSGRARYSLVASDRVETMCGFAPKSVPPIGHKNNIRILVEETLCRQKHNILLGGGGHPKIGCLIASETLLRIENTELASLTISDISSTEQQQQQQDEEQQFTSSTATLLKPYFQFEPPPKEQVQRVLAKPDHPNPLKPQPLTIVGRISGMRRMAQRLVFLDLAPPDYVGTGTKLDSFDLPWRSVLDGEDMGVQLIAGKTFCKNRGWEQEGAEALKKLKVGQLILVEGKTNVGNRESLGHWVNKRSFDIVVFDFRILEEAVAKDPRQQLATVSSPEQSPTHKINTSVVSNNSNSINPDCLQLTDVLNDAATINIVDSKETIADFYQDLQMLSAGIGGDKTPLFTGVDCEWKPNFLLGSSDEPQPVLLLQISIQKINTVYLVDLQTLLRPGQEPTEDTNELETATSEALSHLFGSSHFLKTGYQLLHDFQRLAGSYPHVPAFRSVASVTEVGTVAKKAMQIARIRNAKQLTSSLSRLTRYMVEKPLNKDQQTSDWSQRPLSAAQQEYAALDAAVAPLLLEKALSLADAKWMGKSLVGRYEDDMSFSRTVSSVRFLILESDNRTGMRKLKAKNIISNQWLVTQSWVTGGDPPSPPSAPTNVDDLYVDVTGTQRVQTSRLKLQNKSDPAAIEDLIGMRVGKSKDSCLDAVLSGNEDFPAESKLDYNQRSGYVEFADSVALFVNMPVRPGNPSPRGYPNVWLEEGKKMTWFLRKNEWMDGTSQLAQKLLGNINDGDNEPPALLFVRMKRGHFLCCGRCRVVNPLIDGPSEEEDRGTGQKDWGLMELHLELHDWNKLKNVADFTSMSYTNAVDYPGYDGIKNSSAVDIESALYALARATIEGDLEEARSLAMQLAPRQDVPS